MPIHLTRRDLLRATLATGAGLLLPRTLMADDNPTDLGVDPNRFVLLADLHIAGDRTHEQRGIRPAESLAQAVEAIIALRPRPAGVFIAGDCAIGEGRVEDYALMVELVKPMREAGLPLHIALGNHDCREHFLAAFPDLAPDGEPLVADKHVSIVETPRANWFLLDSLQRPNHTPGRLGEVQLEWLAEALDARPDKPALIMAHHNPDSNPKTSALTDTAELMEVIEAREHAKAYIFGHSHRWHIGHREKDLQLVNLPTLVWVFGADHPRGWVEIELEPEGALFRLHTLDAKSPLDGQETTVEWPVAVPSG